MSTGKAIEGILPDAMAGRILDERALPAFQQGDYSGGLKATTLTVAQILAGDQVLRQRYETSPETGRSNGVLLIFFVLFLVFLLFRSRGGGGPFILGGYGGGFGDGGFGGGFGGGGFGGGSSGGGGAGR
jgi:uncharacterized protein